MARGKRSKKILRPLELSTFLTGHTTVISVAFGVLALVPNSERPLI